MTARRIDKLKKLARGVMYDRVTACLERDIRYKNSCDIAECWTRWFQLEAGYVKMKDVLVAVNMARPTGASKKTEVMLLMAIKRNIEMMNGHETRAIEDETGRYYVTGIVKRTAVEALQATVQRMGMCTNIDMVEGALRKLESTSVQGDNALLYKSMEQTKDVLLIKKEIVNRLDILTDSEKRLLCWIKYDLIESVPSSSRTWTETFDEEGYLITSSVSSGITGPFAITRQAIDGAMSRLKDGDVSQNIPGLADTPRNNAMYWLSHMRTDAGDVVIDASSDAEHPHEQINVHDVGGMNRVPCNADGNFAGFYKSPCICPGAIKINKSVLDILTADVDEGSELTPAEKLFTNKLMAYSGEAEIGTRIYFCVSPIIDGNTAAALTVVVGPHEGSTTILNPRRREKATVVDPCIFGR